MLYLSASEGKPKPWSPNREQTRQRPAAGPDPRSECGALQSHLQLGAAAVRPQWSVLIQKHCEDLKWEQSRGTVLWVLQQLWSSLWNLLLTNMGSSFYLTVRCALCRTTSLTSWSWSSVCGQLWVDLGWRRRWRRTDEWRSKKYLTWRRTRETAASDFIRNLLMRGDLIKSLCLF